MRKFIIANQFTKKYPQLLIKLHLNLKNIQFIHFL